MRGPRMRRFTVQVWLCLLGWGLLSACSTTTNVQPIGTALPSRPENCDVVILEANSQAIGKYEELGKIETHLHRNIFLGGGMSLQEAYPELRAKACQLGGNAVLIDDHIQSSAAEMRYLHVWARVVRRE